MNWVLLKLIFLLGCIGVSLGTPNQTCLSYCDSLQFCGSGPILTNMINLCKAIANNDTGDCGGSDIDNWMFYPYTTGGVRELGSTVDNYCVNGSAAYLANMGYIKAAGNCCKSITPSYSKRNISCGDICYQMKYCGSGGITTNLGNLCAANAVVSTNSCGSADVDNWIKYPFNTDVRKIGADIDNYCNPKDNATNGAYNMMLVNQAGACCASKAPAWAPRNRSCADSCYSMQYCGSGGITENMGNDCATDADGPSATCGIVNLTNWASLTGLVNTIGSTWNNYCTSPQKENNLNFIRTAGECCVTKRTPPTTQAPTSSTVGINSNTAGNITAVSNAMNLRNNLWYVLIISIIGLLITTF